MYKILTILDYSDRRKDVAGLGKIRFDGQQGMLLHPTVAFDQQGVCLGVINYKTWTREELKGRKLRQIVKAVEDKESIRWLESYRATDQLAKKYPNKILINIADREGDFYELLQEYNKMENKAHLIVRAKSNRVLDCHNNENEKKLWERVQNQPIVGKVKFDISDIDKKRKSRQVCQTIRTCEVSFSPPRKVRKLNSLRPISINAVLCKEENPPAGEQAVEWLLLTTLDIKSDQTKIFEVIKYYQLRWQIELYFKVLKSGCNIEKLQLETKERLENALAIYMIIAWRLLFVTYIGRFLPELSCQIFYTESEWKAVYIIAYKKPPPDTPPSISAMNKVVASFGGFLGRKGDGEPGIKAMWIGLQRLKDFT
ncbi:MAG: IS4 family transposase, partial [Rickettsiaceae bacterium]|nr:IS4 family transposase [Rickettsiaceae bacterium]